MTTFLKYRGKNKILENKTFFDSLGNKITEIDYNFGNIYESSFHYNKNNQLYAEISYKVEINKIKNSEILYKYDSANNLIETIYYDYDSLGNINSEYRSINIYEHNKLQKSILQRPLDTLIYSYVYDMADTNKVNIYHSINEKTYGRGEQIYKDKLLIKSTSFSPHDNSYTTTEYIYDKKKNLICIINYPNVLTLEENAAKLRKYTKHKIYYNKMGLEKNWVCYTKGGKKLNWKKLTFYK
ncbi:MAG: hypothetical protein KAX69_04055 [Chitinophagales bacterium]|nr:hypothetical protein [Chitinophagales bacterium]